jgi:predicted transcriptional regulator
MKKNMATAHQWALSRKREFSRDQMAIGYEVSRDAADKMIDILLRARLIEPIRVRVMGGYKTVYKALETAAPVPTMRASSDLINWSLQI